MCVCALGGCAAAGDPDYVAIFGHNVSDVRVLLRDGDEAMVAGRMKEDVPPGIAGLVPFEGYWDPFVASLDGRQRVRWIRRFSVDDAVPRAWKDRRGFLWLAVHDAHREQIERLGNDWLCSRCGYRGD